MREIVASSYPGLVLRIDPDRRLARLEGSITLVAECGVPTDIEVLVKLARNFPHREPAAYDAAGRFPHEPDRHLLRDGQCCLWLPPESAWNADDPQALRQFLDQVALFFERQLIYDVTGEWLGPQRAHGAAGYSEFVREKLGVDQTALEALAPALAGLKVGRNESCPCGNGKKFKRCHLGAVLQVRQAVGQQEIERLVLMWASGRNPGSKETALQLSEQ